MLQNSFFNNSVNISGGPCISHLGLQWCPTWINPPLKLPFHYLRWTTSNRPEGIPFQWRVVWELRGVPITCVCGKFRSDLCFGCVKIFELLRLDRIGVFQTGYIALQRAIRSENIHGCHIEGSFQTEVLNTGYFKGPFVMKDFKGYNWWTIWAPVILCADSVILRAQDDDTEGHFKKQFFGHRHPSKLSLQRVNPFEGIRA